MGIRSTSTSWSRSSRVSVAESLMGVWKVRNGPSCGTSSMAPGRRTSGRSASCGVRSTMQPVAASSPSWMKAATLKKPQRNVHAPVDRIEVTEDRASEDHQPPAVVRCMLQQVSLPAEPQLQALVELGRLRHRVRVVEGVSVCLGCLVARVAPDERGPADQVGTPSHQREAGVAFLASVSPLGSAGRAKVEVHLDLQMNASERSVANNLPKVQAGVGSP